MHIKVFTVAALIALLNTACVSGAGPKRNSINTFLQESERPDLVALLPQPPSDNSPAAQADRVISEQYLTLVNTPRWDMAIQDAAMRYPGGAAAFSCAAGLPLSAETTPLTMKLMSGTAIEIAMSTRAPKQHFQRPRPFMVNGAPVCTPSGMKFLQKDGSYPSGHSAAGWVWGLLLAEMLPEKSDALVQRGRQFGQSRAVCNVHWQSDIDQGRIAGSVLLARLRGSAGFRAALDAARDELMTVKAKNLPLDRDCAAEAAALALE